MIPVGRVGRTARAGRAGRAVTFVSQYDVELYQRIEHLLGNLVFLGSYSPMIQIQSYSISYIIIFVLRG